MVWPFGSRSISDFPALPQSAKSTLSGDTVQLPNLVAYFSNNYRKYVIAYYKLSYQGQTKLPFSPLRLNYPPEDAYIYIKDQTQSTYLEELTYPLRDSLFINGLEPFDETTKEERYAGATKFMESGQPWETKVIMRYYPSNCFSRVTIWFTIVVALYLVSKLFSKTFKHG